MAERPDSVQKPTKLGQKKEERRENNKASLTLDFFNPTPKSFQMKTSIRFKPKLFQRCNKLFRALKHRFKKPIFRQLFRFKKLRQSSSREVCRKTKRRAFLSTFRSFFRSGKMEEVGELKSLTETGRERTLFPSPITPAYMIPAVVVDRKIKENDVEDACRSFENYLVEMLVEEGKVRDLIDVEELLYCWKNLRSPVFLDLVGRFYAELCNDLFSDSAEEVDDFSS